MTKEAVPQPSGTSDLQPTADQQPRVPSEYGRLVLEYRALPHGYKYAAEGSYKGQEVITDGAIHEGHLSEDYILPHYPEFLRQIVALASTYESMTEQGQQPQVIFDLEIVDTTSLEAGASPWTVRLISAAPNEELS